MPDLLLELFCEEIPARMQRKAAGDLKKMIIEALVEKGLSFSTAQEYWTPRRLVLDVRGLSSSTPDKEEEIKGPPTHMNKEAIEAFLSRVGLASIEEAYVREDPKGKGAFYSARVLKKGHAAEHVLAELIPEILKTFPWPRSMRWGKESANTASFKWVRPLRCVLCILRNENGSSKILDFRIGGFRSGDFTFGHRFHAPEKITVHDYSDYVEKLREAKVLLDPQERKNLILKEAHRLVEKENLALLEDEELLEEITGLVEWPNVLLGRFDPAFLSIPHELIECSIRFHQKCFVTLPLKKNAEETKNLSNHFVIVSNIEAHDGGIEIRQGNEKVIQARLSDALYFWNGDRQNLTDRHLFEESFKKFNLDYEKPLDQRMASLDHMNVMFHAKIGTQGERVLRIKELAQDIAGISGTDSFLVARAATLAKADLQTAVVGEFPELQGIIGREYALLQGEPLSISDAIRDHHRPRGPFDTVPEDPVSISVALADKLDMLLTFQKAGEWPTGSRDPYGLRRAAMGVVRIILNSTIHLPLTEILIRHGQRLKHGKMKQAEQEENADFCEKVLSFLQERLKTYLRQKNIRYDVIDAVFEERSDDFISLDQRVRELEAFLERESAKNFQSSIKRVINILLAEEKKGKKNTLQIKEELLAHVEEKELFGVLKNVEHSLKEDVVKGNFSKALENLSSLQKPIDSFFEKIFVNDENPNIRENRFALLARVRLVTQSVARFEYIRG